MINLGELLKDYNSIQSILFVLLIALWITWLWSRRHIYRFAYKCPGPKGFPLIGSLHKTPRLKDLLPFLTKSFSDSKSSNVCIWFGPNPFLVTIDPETIEQVLRSRNFINKSKNFYQTIANNFGDNLITSPIPKWFQHRKLINPTFSHKVLLSFFPIFNKAARVICNKLDTLTGQGEQKLCAIFQRNSLGISIETTMGKEMKEGVLADDSVVFFYQRILDQMMKETLLSMISVGFLIRWNPYCKHIKKSLFAFVDSLISQRLSNKKEKDFNEDTTFEDSISKTPKIFIDQVLQNYQSNQFSWQDLVDESNMIVVAAFETTSNGIYSTIVMLAMHLDIQEKLFQEILSVFPDKEFEVEYEKLEQLTYLDMVINETLRLAPSVPLFGREGLSDTQLLPDLPMLPRGFPIVISIYHLHRSKEIWGPNAHLFNPDNFLPGNLANKHPYAYIPFSKGIRNCIGWRYALMTLKVVLARIIRNYRFTTKFKYEDLMFVESISLKYDVEPMLKVFKR